MDLIFDTRKGGENALKNGKKRVFRKSETVVSSSLDCIWGVGGGRRGKEVKRTKLIDIIKY